jgi:hypothetical protein
MAANAWSVLKTLAYPLPEKASVDQRSPLRRRSLGKSGGRLTPSGTGTRRVSVKRKRSARWPAMIAVSPAGWMSTSGVPSRTPRFWLAGISYHVLLVGFRTRIMSSPIRWSTMLPRGSVASRPRTSARDWSPVMMYWMSTGPSGVSNCEMSGPKFP